MTSLEDDTASDASDDSEESVEINLSRYVLSQKAPPSVILQQKSIEAKSNLSVDEDDAVSLCSTPSSTGTLIDDNSDNESERNDTNGQLHTTSLSSIDNDGQAFYLNQPSNIEENGCLFSRKKYVTDIIERDSEEGVLCVIISTFGLDEVNFINEIPALMGKESTIPTLIMFGKKTNVSDKDNVKELVAAAENVSLHLHLAQVQPRHRRINFMGYSDEGKAILGVHHAKYILVFTRRGLHVMISTANMTPQVCAAEGSFTHFFPLLRPSNVSGGIANDNDFGIVLNDFLNKQSEQLDENTASNHCKAHGNVDSFASILKSESDNSDLEMLMTPKDWYKFYRRENKTNFNPRLCDVFDFSIAKVHLISVVPGCFPIPYRSNQAKASAWIEDRQLETNLRKRQRHRCKQCLLERERLRSHALSKCNDNENEDYDCIRVQYGAARIQEVLLNQRSALRRTLGPKDNLIMQPTSIGSGVDNKYMSEILTAYLPEDHWDNVAGFSQVEGRRMDSLRILWPEASFMKLNASRGHDNDADPDYTDSDNDDACQGFIKERDDDNDDQLVFLLPKTLALMEPDLQSQLHVYDPYPWLLERTNKEIDSKISCAELNRERSLVETSSTHITPPPPHIKSYARVMSNNVICRTESVDFDGNSSCCVCYDLAWFLLTSACLSRGAQGEVVQPTTCKDCKYEKEGFIEYKNFELGVLYHSGTQQRSSIDNVEADYVQYKAYNRNCTVHRHPVVGPPASATTKPYTPIVNEEGGKVIVLPLPYDLLTYDPFCNEKGFLKEPFFHDKSELKKYDGQLQLCKLSKMGENRNEISFSVTTSAIPIRKYASKCSRYTEDHSTQISCDHKQQEIIFQENPTTRLDINVEYKDIISNNGKENRSYAYDFLWEN